MENYVSDIGENRWQDYRKKGVLLVIFGFQGRNLMADYRSKGELLARERLRERPLAIGEIIQLTNRRQITIKIPMSKGNNNSKRQIDFVSISKYKLFQTFS